MASNEKPLNGVCHPSYEGSIYTYDAQNRLTSASNGGTTATFYYDGKNRQIARNISNATQSNVIRISVWDGWELIEEYASATTQAAAYLQGTHGVIKSLLNNVYSYQDKLGSTTHVANAGGQLLESYKYDLYGTPSYFSALNTQLSTSNYSVADLYAGERWIPELGLYDLRNRFMSPELGRFLQPDPIGFKGDASNLYRYCHNDPEDFSDPTGLVASNSAIPDRLWERACFFDSGNSFQGSLQDFEQRRSPAGTDGGAGADGGRASGATVTGQHEGANAKERQPSKSNPAPGESLRFRIRHDKTVKGRYRDQMAYQLATSKNKPLRGFQFIVTEHTTLKRHDFRVANTDDRYGPLTKDGLFLDGVGFEQRPPENVSGWDIREQRFELHYVNGDPGPRVSTVLRHETHAVGNGQFTNAVFVVEP